MRLQFFLNGKRMIKPFCTFLIFIAAFGAAANAVAAPVKVVVPTWTRSATASTRAAEIAYARRLETLANGFDKTLAAFYVAWEKATENRKAIGKLGSTLTLDKELAEALILAGNGLRVQLRGLDGVPSPPLAFRRVSRSLEPARQDVSRSLRLIEIWRATPSEMLEKRAERLLRRGSAGLDDALVETKTIAARLGKDLEKPLKKR
jgi:hypothetical protein